MDKKENKQKKFILLIIIIVVILVIILGRLDKPKAPTEETSPFLITNNNTLEVDNLLPEKVEKTVLRETTPQNNNKSGATFLYFKFDKTIETTYFKVSVTPPINLKTMVLKGSSNTLAVFPDVGSAWKNGQTYQIKIENASNNPDKQPLNSPINFTHIYWYEEIAPIDKAI